MFAVPGFCLRSAIAVIRSLSLRQPPGTSANPEFPLPDSVLSFDPKRQNHASSGQASQNEPFQKLSYNSREVNTCTKHGQGGGGTMRLGRIGVAAIIPLHSYLSLVRRIRETPAESNSYKKGGGWGAAGPPL